MKICPVGAELFHADRQMDGRTDMLKPIAILRVFANVPKNGYDRSMFGVTNMTSWITNKKLAMLPDDSQPYMQQRERWLDRQTEDGRIKTMRFM
jgi:hypothetical protein